jgi:hypothetical protein
MAKVKEIITRFFNGDWITLILRILSNGDAEFCTWV